MHRVLLLSAVLSCAAAPLLAAPQDAPVDPRAALSEWRAEHGPAWSAFDGARTGRVELLAGGRVEPDFRPERPADFTVLAREAVVATAPLHGVDPETLLHDRTLSVPLAHLGTTDKVTVRFRQAKDGVPVQDGFANVLLDAEGGLLSVQTTALVGLDDVSTRPAWHALRATERAVSTFAADEGLEPSHLHVPELVIDAFEEGERSVARLVWRVGVEWRAEGVVPVGTTYSVDATDGSIRGRENRVHHFDVSGTVSTWASPGSAADSPANPPALLPLGRANVTSSAGTTTTDENGNFTFSGVSSVNNVQVQYLGSYVNVNNQAGADHSVNAGTLSGASNTIVLNPTQAALVTAQANAHRGVSFFRDWVRSVNPGDSTMDFQATANTNLSQTCNAFYDGGSTNYFQAGGGCRNTSFSAIVAHEQGHWANSRYGTGNGNDGMGEGNADVFAMYQYDTPLVGEGFFTGGGQVRTGTNTRQYCGDGNGGCYGQVHTDGEVWMGAAWKIRRNLKSTLGTTLGGDVADALFMGWMNAYNQTQIHSIIETQWLTLDDDNGNILDGTPNFADVDAGFREQGFPGIELVYVDLTNVTLLDDTPDTAGPYVVTADVQAVIDGPLSAVSLLWRVHGAGSFNVVPMTPLGGTTWSGAIPGPQDNAIVEYAVSASNSGGQSAIWPENGVEAWPFGVGAVTSVLADNFESDLGWTVTSAPELTAGAWERANPQGTTQGGQQAQPENDFGLGTLCYVTGASAGTGVGSFDVDGGPTRLFTPTFDLSAGDGIVSLAVWFYNDDGDDDLRMWISNDGGTNYALVRVWEPTGGWIRDAFVVSDYVTPTDDMKIRIRAIDEPNNSITEALIDEVHIRAVAGSTCPDPTSYCPATVNSTGNAASLGWSGSTSITVNDLTFSGLTMPINTNGVVIYSPDQVSTPLGDGTLCVGNTTLGFVLRLPAFTSDFLGSVVYPFDNTAPPAPEGQVGPGETWFFQIWYRDPAAGGAGFNFSDALTVVFCP